MPAPETLLTEMIEATNLQDLSRFKRLFADDLTGNDCSRPGQMHSPTDVVLTIERLLNAFPDLALSVDDFVLGKQSAAVLWTATGSHHGMWMSIPATGRSVKFQGLWVIHTGGGWITSFQSVWDTAGLLRGLGLLPDL